MSLHHPDPTPVCRQPPGRREPSLAALVDAARGGPAPAGGGGAPGRPRGRPGPSRRFGLSHAQADDVLQTAWLRLFQHLGALRSSDAVGAWLTVTARREAFLALQEHVREFPTDTLVADEVADLPGPDEELLDDERRAVLGRAIATLPSRHRRLMELMVREPGLDYRQVSVRTGIPLGSIGPIRGRCVLRMADHPEVQALRD